MATVKPIQATPVLSGRDAEKIIAQVNKAPSEEAMKKNCMLRDILMDIRK